MIFVQQDPTTAAPPADPQLARQLASSGGEQHAARIFLSQARRPDLADTPRLMARAGGGGEFRAHSWRELASSVERLAAVLVELGVDVDTRAAVLSNTRVEWGVAGLAIIAARGTLVPVYPTLSDESLAHVLAHSETRVLFVESQAELERVLRLWDELCLERIITFDEVDVAATARAVGLDETTLRARVLAYQTAAGERGAALLSRDPTLVHARLERAAGEDVAYMLYTSGTTGLPKGVPLTHDNVGRNGDDWLQINGPLVEEGDRDLLWLPMSHIFGWGEFCLGNQLAMVSYISAPARVLDDLREVRPHVFMAVPAYWEKLAKTAINGAASSDEDARRAELLRVTGGRLRFCLSGGAGLTRDIKDFFYSAGMLIIEGYGLTECSPTLTLNRPDDFDFDTVGKPLPSVELRLADDGEILARGPNVFSGYFKDPQATASAFDREGWLHTGDLGRFTARGFLQIIGRKKEILVTAGGKNVPPANIELRFAADPLISQLVVYGDGKKYLTALVDIDEAAARVLLGDAEQRVLTAAQLRAAPAVHAEIKARIDRVNAKLARYETIKAFVVAGEPLTVEAGLLTPSLKVKREQVYEAYGARLDALYGG